MFAHSAQCVGLANSSDRLGRATAPVSGASIPVTAVCVDAALTKGRRRRPFLLGPSERNTLPEGQIVILAKRMPIGPSALVKMAR